METGAIISSDGKYRYKLWRHWGPGPKVLFIMLNPSTADETTDDATIRRCVQCARNMEFEGITVVNLFPLRATDPEELKSFPMDTPIEENFRHIKVALEETSMVICAWGKHGNYCNSGEAMKRFLNRLGHTAFCLGTNKDGTPKHPLYLKYKQQPVLFN